MPVLDNPRHERFAQNLARGMRLGEAYTAAGYTGHSGNPCRLRDDERIRSRVREINEEAALLVGVTRAWVLQQLRANYERAAQAEPVLNHEGDPTGEFTWAGAVANRALERLGKDIGMFAERTIDEHTGKDGQPIAVVTQAVEAVGGLLTQLAAKKNGLANESADDPPH